MEPLYSYFVFFTPLLFQRNPVYTRPMYKEVLVSLYWGFREGSMRRTSLSPL